MKYPSLIILILFLYSCKKDKVAPLTVTQLGFSKIDSTLLPFLFDSSSYWIYSNGSLVDTISLISVERQEIYVTPKQAKEEVFILHYESSAFNSYTEKYIGAIVTIDWLNDGWVYTSILGLGESFGGLTFLEKIDTLTVDNQAFYNVSKFKVQQGNYFSNDMHVYFCDSIGAIRKEIVSGSSVVQTWDLIQYNVQMYTY